MKVTISYHDDEALHPEELIQTAKSLFGSASVVKVTPDSNNEFAQLYFALQTVITRDQANLFFDDPDMYQYKILELERSVMEHVRSVLTHVVADNEEKLST